MNNGIPAAVPSPQPFRVCILDVARGYTIDATYDVQDVNPAASPPEIKYPHDAEEALKAMPSFRKQGREVIVETLFLKPDPRKAISEVRRRKHTTDLFFNLYDLADATGQELVNFMERNSIAFTGAGSLFYDPTREELKRRCRHAKIHSPAYVVLVGEEFMVDDVQAQEAQLARVVEDLGGFPLFIKPEHGFDSVGIDEHSVARNMKAFRERAELIVREWGSALVEQYIDGREFTVLVAGGDLAVGFNNNDVNGAALGEKLRVYSPVEYVFEPDRQRHPDRPEAISFITFQDKWGPSFRSHWAPLQIQGKEDESRLQQALISLTRSLYVAFEGEGFARVDVRQDSRTGQLMVLDINPNCSLFYRDGCSADTVLALSGTSKPEFAELLVNLGLRRQARSASLNNTVVRFHANRGFALHATRALQSGAVVYSDEMGTLRLVTKGYVEQHWTADEMVDFHTYAWPVGPDTYAIWHPDWRQWKNINHSCDPNCWMKGLSVVARRDIAQGEELTMDYATFLPDHPPFKCWCGAADRVTGTPLCRGQLRPGDYLDAEFIKRYRGYCSPFIEDLISRQQHQGGASSHPQAIPSILLAPK